MNTTARILAAAVAVLALTLSVGAGAVLAADPSPTVQPTVGGTLSAGGRTIEVYSNGNVPSHVHMTAEVVTLSESDFDILPGQTHRLTFSGPKAVGTVSALYTTIPHPGEESGSATLTLNLTPGKYIPPFDWTPFLIGGLIAAAFAIPARWVKRNVRISRKAAA
jgi:hypothetical protein